MEKKHEFAARVERIAPRAPYFALDVPARVSKSIARKGPIPIVATLNGFDGVNATLIARGGGKHRIFLNGAVRRRVGLGEGDRVAVSLVVDETPPVEPLPEDLADALREVGALATWEKWTRAKKNHIIQWIEKAAKDATRAKYVARTVELAMAARDKAIDREARRRR